MEDDEKRCLDKVLSELPAAREAWSRMTEYQEGVQLAQGHSVYFTNRELRKVVQNAVVTGFSSPVLFVDYGQIVPVDVNELGWVPTDDLVRIGVIMAALKGIATDFHCTVVVVAAADAEGLRQQRIHLENLWGPARMQYDPDTALILNRGTADPSGPGITSVRLAIEKQRNGPQMIEMEFELDGQHYAFKPVGRLVDESESFQAERIALRKAMQGQQVEAGVVAS